MASPDARPFGGSTTGAGAPAPSDRNSLTVGTNGPLLLHDVHFIEQMAHFNREKVPERQPHAKGSGAFGVFETTADVSKYTKAALSRRAPPPTCCCGSPRWPARWVARTRGAMCVASP
jgi:catalase